MIDSLNKHYKEKKKVIRNRLKDFEKVWKGSDKKIFAELCFCICTPQSKAVYCDKAVKNLERSGKLYTGGVSEIKKHLKAVRFPNNKARYIVESRKLFSSSTGIKIKKRIDTKNIYSTRDWLVKNVKGLGYKEASHFLRNIGWGRDLAILDTHIMKNMARYGLIKETPKAMSKKCYFDLEKRLKKFSLKIDIPMAELDLLFWSEETGEVFK